MSRIYSIINQFEYSVKGNVLENLQFIKGN